MFEPDIETQVSDCQLEFNELFPNKTIIFLDGARFFCIFQVNDEVYSISYDRTSNKWQLDK